MVINRVFNRMLIRSFGVSTKFLNQTDRPVVSELARCLERFMDPSALVRGVHRDIQHRLRSHTVADGRRAVHEQNEERGERRHRNVQLDAGFPGDEVLPGHGGSHGDLIVVRYVRRDKFNGHRIRLHDGAGDEGPKRRGDSDRVVRDAN